LEQLFDKLKELIARQTSAYGELLELSRSEKEAIIKNDVPKLNAIVEQEQKVLKTIKKLESERKELFSSFSEETGIEKPYISDIIAMTAGPVGEELKATEEELESTAAELNRVNKINKMLIETQIQYSSFYMDLLAGPVNTMETYSNSGRLNDKAAVSNRLLDQSV
jgi:flagellar biosynthesis/type III secretory pathway chaperone